jgi:hypothetical protein
VYIYSIADFVQSLASGGNDAAGLDRSTKNRTAEFHKGSAMNRFALLAAEVRSEVPIPMSIERSVRRAVLGDEPILREVRLQALSDAPQAFGSTLDKELARSNADWGGWLSPGATFILYESEKKSSRGMSVPDTSTNAWGFVQPALRGVRERDGLIEVQMERLVCWQEIQ